MGNAESQSAPKSAGKDQAHKKIYHPNLETLCRRLKAASGVGKTTNGVDLDINLLRSVFQLDGDRHHVTHLPSSPTKNGANLSPAERCHQAPTPSIGSYLINYIAAKAKCQSEALAAEDFLRGCQEILDTMSETNYCAEMYIGYDSSSSDFHLSLEMDEIHLRHMLLTCFHLYQDLHQGSSAMTMEDQYLINSLVISIMKNKKTISRDDLLSWTYENCPRLFGSTHAWLIRALVDLKGPVHSNPKLNDLCGAAINSSLPPELAFNSQSASSPPHPSSPKTRTKLSSRSSSASLKSLGSMHSDQILCCVLKWLLSGLLARSYFLSTLQDKFEDAPSDPMEDKIKSLSQPVHWTLLYNSNSHGLSMNRFQHHVFSYQGQTMMLVELEAGDLYVVAADAEWKESTSRYGGIDALILEAVPRFRSRDSGREVLYLNEFGRSLPKGILLGRDPKIPILKIDSSFDICTASNGIEQNIRAVEVWGCSTSRALDKQNSQKNWEQGQAVQGQAVGRKAAFGGGGRGARAGWKDNPDRQLLEMGGVTTEHNDRN